MFFKLVILCRKKIQAIEGLGQKARNYIALVCLRVICKILKFIPERHKYKIKSHQTVFSYISNYFLNIIWMIDVFFTFSGNIRNDYEYKISWHKMPRIITRLCEDSWYIRNRSRALLNHTDIFFDSGVHSLFSLYYKKKLWKNSLYRLLL